MKVKVAIDATNGRYKSGQTYSVPGSCGNCGWSGQIVFSKGDPARRVTCGVCGCYAAVPMWPDVPEQVA